MVVVFMPNFVFCALARVVGLTVTHRLHKYGLNKMVETGLEPFERSYIFES